jgi:hypothetical protein
MLNQTSHSLHWDSDQRDVIEAPAIKRMNVEAGPGAGKTAVACARVAHLIGVEGVEPGNILLISFTRTAVYELRDRISRYLDNSRDAASIRISTVDSFSWRFWTGFLKDEINDPFAGFDCTIESAIRMLEDRHPDLLQYLQDYRHVIVDEAQDLTSLRLQLIRCLFAALAEDCGITVFSDPAQAIYGFTLRDSGEDLSSGSIVTENAPWDIFERRRLVKVHRTDTTSLRLLWEAARPFLLEDEGFSARDCYAQVHSMVRSLASARTNEEGDVENRRSELYLFRTRASALARASVEAGRGISSRLRMSGLPTCVMPWIGAALMDHQDHRLDRQDFAARWASVPFELRARLEEDSAWNLLLRYARVAGTKSIDTKKLRTQLARPRPPVEMCLPDFGLGGPIFGTIHGSKGREADYVHLCLPKDSPAADKEEELEEARVLYVGATRPKIALSVSVENARAGGILRLDGRVRICQRSRAGFGTRVEFGRDGDTEWQSALRSDIPDQDIARNQAWLRSWNASSPVKGILRCIAARGFRYALSVEDRGVALLLCWLSEPISRDLFAVARTYWPQQRLRPSHNIQPVWITGVQTVVLSPEDPALPTIPFPHQGSGFGLAPVWFGYPRCNFFPYAGKRQEE